MPLDSLGQFRFELGVLVAYLAHHVCKHKLGGFTPNFEHLRPDVAGFMSSLQTNYGLVGKGRDFNRASFPSDSTTVGGI